jgi:hypothetical protein
MNGITKVATCEIGCDIPQQREQENHVCERPITRRQNAGKCPPPRTLVHNSVQQQAVILHLGPPYC